MFKLVGPVLVKQDLAEARANIDKRIEYIKTELTRVDVKLKSTDGKLNDQKRKVLTMQQVPLLPALLPGLPPPSSPLALSSPLPPVISRRGRQGFRWHRVGAGPATCHSVLA